MDRKAHWEHVYTNKQPTEVSWYQAEATLSLELLRDVATHPETRLIDVGGGDSTFVDAVVAMNLARMTVLDISAMALMRARGRLGKRAEEVAWIEADVTRVDLPDNAFDVWHDRAVFHFLNEPADRVRYAAVAAAAVRPGGTLLIATFAPDGPTRCSGLHVERYSPEGLARELGDAFVLTRGFGDVHTTPAGIEQRFTAAVLRRR